MRIYVVKGADGAREVLIEARRGLGLPASLIRGADRAAVMAEVHTQIEALSRLERTRTVPRDPQ